jgi:oxygen-independent coproporphyrinogen-3 oxidase
VPGAQPSGVVAPEDGRLPPEALTQVGSRPFGIYLHVPFCVTRCGYCDFNTYTATERGTDPGATLDTWADAALAELDLARRVLGAAVPVTSVFVGGGTPSLLDPRDLGRVLAGITEQFGLEAGAEVTSEANPESATREWLVGARTAGVNRLSLGMQSARPHVLAVLDRVHSPGRVAAAVADARAAGFTNVSLDLIYGTPGESLDDWDRTLEAAMALRPDHVSAYALIIEPGTRLAARVGRGEVPVPDDDLMAAMYELADDHLTAAGLQWYELSNWAAGPSHRSRHNGLYWTDADWWGVGPGAHSHVRGVRWWNVKHPAAWAGRLTAGQSPAAAREVLDEPTRRLERVMLGLRTREGASSADVEASLGPARTDAEVAALVAEGLLEPAPASSGGLPTPWLRLTRRGRLLADAVTLRLT